MKYAPLAASALLPASKAGGQRWRVFCAGIAALVAAVFVCAAAQAEDLHPRLETARDGQSLIAALQIVIPAEFHAYGHEPGEAGRPTTVALSVDGGRPLAVHYPEGAVQRDYYDPTATVNVYEGNVAFYATLPPDAAGKPFVADISMLLCSSRKCVPVNEQFAGTVPRDAPAVNTVPWHTQWQEMRQQPPIVASTARADAEQEDAGNDEAANAMWANETAQSNGVWADENQNKLPPPDGFDVRLSPRFLDDSLEISGLGKALLFGILAGLLLNAMPCVLPVLTFKVSGLLMVGGRDAAGLKRFRQHNLCFAAGVMTLFSALALVLGLADLMWGQLYQNQAVLMVMLLVVYLMGLSTLGVFSLPVIDLKTGASSKNPCLQAYFTGLVSTFLATPCSGPLLGGVLGWAFTQPLIIVMVVFWAVGLGMALPYLMFCVWPDLACILPKPGAWMHVFERVVGFMLMGTALYLLSVLPVERHMQVLTVLLVLSLCAWLWGQYCGITAPPLRRKIMSVVGVGLLVASVFWVLRPVAPLPQWRQFTPEAFEAHLGKKPMLLEFTANWCPNCKFMEATVLTDERMRKLQARYGMELVRVDLTNANAYAVRLLDALGSKSIPLTALFPAGDYANQPLVLRDVYSARTLEQALNEAYEK